MLDYTNLSENAAIKFGDAMALMGTRLKEKYTYLKNICTFPSTWDQNELEDAVDRYARAENPCNAVDNMVDGKLSYNPVTYYNFLYEHYYNILFSSWKLGRNLYQKLRLGKKRIW